MFSWITLATLVALFIVWKMCIVVPMREAYVKQRLGRFAGVLKPGFHFLIPFVDRIAYKQEMREQVIDIPAQACVTRDNIQVEVDGLVYLKVMDAEQASYGIENYRRAAVNLAQTTMRAEIGKLTLDNTFSERERINDNIVREVDKASSPWGIKVMRYEIRNIEPSAHVVETLEKQMVAERQKRARILLASAEKEARINQSEGERQEAVNLSEGERERRINEANGRAREITLLAEATATSIQRVAEAVQHHGGGEAVRVKIIESFIHQFGDILKSSDVSVLPTEMASLKGLLEGVARIATPSAPPRATTSEPQPATRVASRSSSP
jgi:regulator of protease activity HflC (stomatin/prohibitin superfamily)